MTTLEHVSAERWASMVAAATVDVEVVKLGWRGKGSTVYPWGVKVTVEGVDAADYLDCGAFRTKREALAAPVEAAVRESLSDPWNLWNVTDPNGRPDPVVEAILTKP